MAAPFFSIILPTFNRAHLLPRAIQSVFNQDFKDWELIVIDDGSSDATVHVLDTLQIKDKRIRALINPHQGLAKTRNSGIELTRGAYVTFIDSDDEYLPGHLSQHANYLQENQNVDMCRSNPEVVGDPYVPDFEDNNKKIHIHQCVLGSTFIIKSEILKRMGGYPNLSFGEDTEFWRMATEMGFTQAVSPYQSYRYYRTETDSICNRLINKLNNEN